jgi:hypothetical protein
MASGVVHDRVRDIGRTQLFQHLFVVVTFVIGLEIGAIRQSAAESNSPQSKPALDFDFFRTRVEPIFLEKRTGHTRCYVCHVESNNHFRLEKLLPGARSWSEDQSRRNFEMVSKLVNVRNPDYSRLLQQPLAPEGGGSVFHSGGRQFMSKNDPGWKTIAQWISGAKLAAPAKQ